MLPVRMAKALLEFRGMERVKEECRELHWENFIDGMLRDFRYTLRALAKDVRFSVLAILALGLGIGLGHQR